MNETKQHQIEELKETLKKVKNVRHNKILCIFQTIIYYQELTTLQEEYKVVHILQTKVIIVYFLYL